MSFKVGDRVKSVWDSSDNPDVGTVISVDPVLVVRFNRVVSSGFPEENYVHVDSGSSDWEKDLLTKNFRADVHEVLEALEEMLVEKNFSYGQSAFSPVRIFSDADESEGIRVRIDDKLSRIMHGRDYGEDTIQDLMGYLVLLTIKEKKGA